MTKAQIQSVQLGVVCQTAEEDPRYCKRPDQAA